MLSLARQGKKQSDEYKALEKTLKQNNATLELNKKKIRELENTIGIANLTLTQLKRRAAETRVALANMAPGTAQFKAYSAELAQINARIGELSGRAKVAALSMGAIADKLNRYQTMIAGAAAAFTGVVISFSRFTDFQHKLADAQADVMKTTGLTKAEVEELGKSFSSFNTRTPRLELLKLAEEGGRLGIQGSENLLKYTNAANKLKVALGDDLSDVQIREVGKLTEVYKIGAQTGRDFEQSMQSLGSAINEVAASGANQASFQVDYLKRQAGIATQAKIGAANNIGYAATFDEIGQSVEVSATAMNKVWMDMFNDASTYAKIAGMSLKDFTTLLNTDSNAAMKVFLRGLNGNNEGLSVMVQKLADLDVGGVRGAQALSALAGNVDKLEQKQKIANNALIENVSLLNEYDVKNNNVAASLDKINKKVQGWFTSEKLTKFFEVALDGFAKFIGATEDTDGSVTRFRDSLVYFLKILSIVTVSLLSYKAAVQLAAIWTNRDTQGTLLYNIVLKAQNVLTALGIMRTQAFAAAKLLLTGNIRGAIVALRQMNLVLGLSPWGAVIALVTACTAAYFAFREETGQLIDKQRILNEVRAESEKSIANEVSQIQRLFKIAKDENLTKEQRIKAIKELNRISPEYLGNLKLETIHLLQSTKAIEGYINMLRKKAKEQVFNRKIEDNESKRIELENKKQKDYDWFGGALTSNKVGNTEIKPLYDKYKSLEKDKLKQNTFLAEQTGLISTAILKYEEELKRISDEKRIIDAQYSEFLQSNPDILPTSGNDEISIPTTPTPSSSDKKNKKDKAKQEREKQLKDLQKQNEDIEKEIEGNSKRIYQLYQDNEDTRTQLLSDGYEKELTELKRTNEKKIQSLEYQLHSEEKLQTFREAMAATEKELSTAETKKDKEKADVLRQRLGLMASVYQQRLVENKGIQENIITSWEIYNTKLSTITEKGVNDRIEKMQKEFEEQRKSAQNRFTTELRLLSTVELAKEKLKDSLSAKELSKIKTLNQARAALRKEFEKQELEEQKAHLEKLVEELNLILNSSEWEGMDLTVLTEEQKEAQTKKIEELKAKIAELQELIGQGEKKDQPTGDGLLSSLGGSKDILGMSPEQWEKLFANTDNLYDKMAKVIAAAQLMQNAFTSYYEYVNANEQARVQQFEDSANQQKATFKKQLDEGYISQEVYDKKVEKLENELAKRKALAEYRAAKRKRSMDIASAITSTSLAIVNALATVQPFWAALAMSAVAAAMGAVQIATIQKTPLPSISGYEKGKYNNLTVQRAQDGKIFNADFGGQSQSGIVKKPTVFLAGENNFPEMIIDGKTLTRMKPDVKEAMIQEVSRINGFEKGYYPKSQTDSVTQGSDSDVSLMMLLELRKQNEYLKLISEKESIAVLDSSPYQMAKLAESQKNYERIKNNGKVN